MVKRHRQIALFVAGFCSLCTVGHAQNTAFSTDFDGTDIVNGTTTPTTYASPNFSATYTSTTDRNATGPTAPLATQNGWTSTDNTGPIGHGVFSTGNPNQINGGTDYVGGLAANNGTNFFNGSQGGALGGIYSATAQTPYAVPSTASNGTVTLLHAVTVPAQTSSLVFTTDFAIISNVGGTANAAGTDTFRFVLANAAGASVLSVNFTPTATPSAQENFSGTSGGTTVNSSNAVDLNSQYKLKVTITPGTTPTYAVLISGATGSPQGFSGNLGAALSTITQVGASWTLANQTPASIVNGGYTGASDNVLAFDNFVVTVPEPSTDAMMALGLVGAAGLLVRSRRQQA